MSDWYLMALSPSGLYAPVEPVEPEEPEESLFPAEDPYRLDLDDYNNLRARMRISHSVVRDSRPVVWSGDLGRMERWANG